MFPDITLTQLGHFEMLNLDFAGSGLDNEIDLLYWEKSRSFRCGNESGMGVKWSYENSC